MSVRALQPNYVGEVRDRVTMSIYLKNETSADDANKAADEVRKLAERTKLSTQDIATMIEAIRNGTVQAVGSMTQGTVMVNDGMKLVGHTGNSMATIHGSTNKVLAAIDGISTSLREQSHANNEIARSVENIAQMSERNHAAISDVVSSADQLQMLSDALRQSAARFQIR